MIRLPNNQPWYWANKGPFVMGGKNCARIWESSHFRLKVLVSKATDEELGEWIHASVSKPYEKEMLPTWEEMCRVKNDFLGRDNEAYQVMAKESEYVNVAQCLHLWMPLDGKSRIANLQRLINEVAI